MSSPGQGGTYASLQARGRELDHMVKLREGQEFKHLIESHVISPKDIKQLDKVADYLNEVSYEDKQQQYRKLYSSSDKKQELMVSASSIQRLPRQEATVTQPQIFRRVMAMETEEDDENLYMAAIQSSNDELADS